MNAKELANCWREYNRVRIDAENAKNHYDDLCDEVEKRFNIAVRAQEEYDMEVAQKHKSKRKSK
jgi:hypothetical protein